MKDVDIKSEFDVFLNLYIKNTKDLPSPSTLVSQVFFNNEFDMLITKIKRSGVYVRTLCDILSLTDSQVAKLNGVGVKYIKLWKILKKIYNYFEEDINLLDFQNEANISLDNVDLSNFFLIHATLTHDEVKALEKFGKEILNYTLKDILDFSGHKFAKISGIGSKFIDTMTSIKIKLKKELENIVLNESYLYGFESNLVAPINIGDNLISLEKLSELILFDIESFLDKQNSMMQDIFQKRWGFSDVKQTLEEIGQKYNISRERVRQLEKKCNESLLKSLRVNSNNACKIIDGNINFNLSENMIVISECFYDEKFFFEFLEFLCNRKDIYDYLKPKISLDLLGDFFARNGMPSNYDEVKDYIYDYSLINNMKIDIDNAICVLQENNRIIIDGEKIIPKNLKKEEASACILAKHKNGLPWFDIAKLVNMANISRTNFYLDRLDHASFNNPDTICLAGKGIYKHIRFMNLDAIDIDRVFDELLVVFIDSKETVIHLGDICRDSDYLKTIDYYVIRYLIKYMGEQYGFYFDGKSQTDSVSIESNFKNVTQKDVIIQALKRNKKPMTKVEIASLLKSKSINHAAFYLDQMMKNQQVVQVDRMLYTLPELAYEDIDMELFLEKIQFVLKLKGKPVDPSIFEVELNQLLNQTYSRYFYASIAKKYSQERGWFRSLNLYSMTEIPFKNLMDAIAQICSPSLTIDENCQKLQQRIAITREKASITIGQWIRG